MTSWFLRKTKVTIDFSKENIICISSAEYAIALKN